MIDEDCEIDLISSQSNNESEYINEEELDNKAKNFDSSGGFCFDIKNYEKFLDAKNNISTSSISENDSSIYKDKNALKKNNKGEKNCFYNNSNNCTTNNNSNSNFSNNINDSINEENRKILQVELLFIKPQNEIKQGRKTKKELETSTSIKDKFAIDNIFRKIKTNYFNDFIINLINAKIKSVFGYQKYLIRKICKEIVKDTTIRFNLKLFDLKLSDLLSKDISKNYKTVQLNANKEILEKIENNEKFNKILNCKIIEIYLIFLSKDYKEIISENFEIDKNNITFNNMNGVIEKLRKEKNDNDEYLETLEYYFNNINLLIDESKARKQRKEKIKLDDSIITNFNFILK